MYVPAAVRKRFLCMSLEVASYVSGLLIDTRVVAMLGLRSHRDLISGQVQIDRMGRQILGA